MRDSRLALFLMLGQTASRQVRSDKRLAPSEALLVSEDLDLAQAVPSVVHDALQASEAFKLFFAFEDYLRRLIVDVLSNDAAVPWWDRLPSDVKRAVDELEETEETKQWMAIGTRNKSALMTYPQLLKVIDDCWKDGFKDVVRDKSLVQEARVLIHLRNTVAHMTPVPAEEIYRIRRTMQDWFRMVAP